MWHNCNEKNLKIPYGVILPVLVKNKITNFNFIEYLIFISDEWYIGSLYDYNTLKLYKDIMKNSVDIVAWYEIPPYVSSDK